MSETEITIGGDTADIPEGTYPATLSTIEVMHSDTYDSDFRVWTFTLENGSEVSGSSSMFTSSKSKGGKWIRALLGRKPDKGEKVTLAGRSCQVVVQEDGNGWPKVTDVIPPAAAPVATAAGASVPSATPVAAGAKDDLPF